MWTDTFLKWAGWGRPKPRAQTPGTNGTGALARRVSGPKLTGGVCQICKEVNLVHDGILKSHGTWLHGKYHVCSGSNQKIW